MNENPLYATMAPLGKKNYEQLYYPTGNPIFVILENPFYINYYIDNTKSVKIIQLNGKLKINHNNIVLLNSFLTLSIKEQDKGYKMYYNVRAIICQEINAYNGVNGVLSKIT